MTQDGLFSSNADKKTKKKKKVGFESVGILFNKYQVKDKGGYISQEFQDFGYRLAVQLNDLTRVSMYMRMAKKDSRAMLEKALSFVSDSNAKSKAALFMWKMKQLREEKKESKKNE